MRVDLGEPKNAPTNLKKLQQIKKTTQKYHMKHGPQKHKKRAKIIKNRGPAGPRGGGAPGAILVPKAVEG